MTLHHKLHWYLTAWIACCSLLAVNDCASSSPISMIWGGEAVTIGGQNSNIRPPEPGDSLFLRSGSIRLDLEPPEPDDIDKLIHFDPDAPPLATWTMREEDAATYGLDWTAFQDSLNGADRRAVLTFGAGAYGTFADATTRDVLQDTGLPDLTLQHSIKDFSMEEIRVTVDYYFWHPLIPTLRTTSIKFEIAGTGVIVPEQGSLAMLTVAMLIWSQFGAHRRR